MGSRVNIPNVHHTPSSVAPLAYLFVPPSPVGPFVARLCPPSPWTLLGPAVAIVECHGCGEWPPEQLYLSRKKKKKKNIFLSLDLNEMRGRLLKQWKCYLIRLYARKFIIFLLFLSDYMLRSLSGCYARHEGDKQAYTLHV